MKDLVILAADKDLEFALRGMLSRPKALGTRTVEEDIFVHPEHDPACALRGVDFLDNLSGQYRFGLLIFDHEGSGMEAIAPQELQKSLNAKFVSSAWGNRARAIVLVPELEACIWSTSPNIDHVVGWKNHKPGLRPWLMEQGWLQAAEVKPAEPQKAFEAALREVRKPRSASLYQQIAEKVSLRQCTDAAFLELKGILSNWFPPESEENG